MPFIKLYETMPLDNENVLKGISPKIPAVVSFDETLDNTYITMTDYEYQSYLNSIQLEIEQWSKIQEGQ